MALQSSGEIRFSQIRTELGLSGEIRYSDSQLRGLAGVASGQIRLQDFYGKSSGAGEAGEAEFTTPGTYSWTAPAGVTSVSVVAVGGGGGGAASTLSTNGFSGGGGGGGGLGWKNNISVTPSQSYTIVVGSAGLGGSGAGFNDGTDGGDSYFINTSTVMGTGGARGAYNSTSTSFGGTFVGDGGGNGGVGGGGSDGNESGGGGGAGGYSGPGGRGGTGTGAPTSGSGGSGGGHSGVNSFTGKVLSGGGGVGINGEGSAGSAVDNASGTVGANPGSDGSGKNYGGGGSGSEDDSGGGAGDGGGGAVKIIWGSDVSYPTGLIVPPEPPPAPETIVGSTTQFVSFGQFRVEDNANDTSANYSVSEITFNTSGTKRIIIAHKTTANPTFYSDAPIACVQVLNSAGTSVIHQYWFGISNQPAGWQTSGNTNTIEGNPGISISPITAADLTYTNIVNSSSRDFYGMATSTGSSKTGAVDGIAQPSGPMTPGEAAIPQSFGTYYLYKETSGSTANEVTFIRSPAISWVSGQKVRVAYIIGNSSTASEQQTLDDTLFITLA